MPNQRDKEKKGITVYVQDVVKERLVEEARRRGMTLADYTRELFREELIRRGYKLEKK